MSWIHMTSVLLIALALIFGQSSLDLPRRWLGAQPDLLPSLMVYTSLSTGLPGVTALAILGGMGFDSLSANPMGTSIMPLFLVGFTIERYRGLILQNQAYAQGILGLMASAAVPFLSVLMLLNGPVAPLLGWGSLWQWLVMSLSGALAAPLWFWCFGRITHALDYSPMPSPGYHRDRELKRGRG